MPEPITSAAGLKALLHPSIIAGLVGSVISLRFASQMNVIERITTVMIGAAMAQYFAPLAAFELGLQTYEESVSFFIGLFGLSLTAAVYDTIKKSDPWGLIMARYGKSVDGGQ